jgi:hypothetical protein
MNLLDSFGKRLDLAHTPKESTMSNMLLGPLHYQVMRDGLFFHEKRLTYVAGGALNNRDKIIRFVRDLAAMNAIAYNSRYGENCRAPALRGAVVYQPSLMQMYKNLTCFMYQADYGDTVRLHPKTSQIFKELLSEIADIIIHDMVEYQEAPWSAENNKDAFEKIQVKTDPRTTRLKTIYKTAKRF